MIFNLFKDLLKVKIKNCGIRTLNVYKGKTLRNISSQKDPCKPKPVLLNPDCKTAVVTGGTEGVGLGVAHQLLCEKAKKVALIGLNTKKGAEAVNMLNCAFGKYKAVFFKCDVRDKCDVEDTMNRIKTDFEDIDLIVNAAGIWNDTEWQDELQTNLVGTINVTLSARQFIDRGNGVVINIAGFPGLEPFAPSPLFATCSAGIIHFSRCFGHDDNFRRLGIRVVALSLGVTRTDLLNDIHQRMLTAEMGKSLAEYLKNACSQKPEACGKAVIELIKYGPTGSVWFLEGSRLFFYDVPEYKKFLNLVSQFV